MNNALKDKDITEHFKIEEAYLAAKIRTRVLEVVSAASRNPDDLKIDTGA